MIERDDLNEFLNSIYQCGPLDDFCINGLQVNGKKIIKRIAVAVTASLAVIQSAIDSEADALLVHHGLFWKGTEPLSLTGALYERVKLLVKNDISLFAYHLPMDGHRLLGNCWGAAIDLGLENLQPLSLHEKEQTSIAVMGCWHKSKALCKVIEELTEYYGQIPRVAASDINMPIKKVGICSGGAHRFLDEALDQGVDLFISGTGDESQWHMAREAGKSFISVGHFASERIGPQKIAKVLREQFHICVCFLDEDNPF